MKRISLCVSVCVFVGALAAADWDSTGLVSRAWTILEENTLGGPDVPWVPYRGCRPSCIGFKGVWNWDSAFHALVLVRRDPELARDQFRIMMKIQRPDGMLPDVIWEDPKDGVFDGCTKPPVWGWGVWTIDRMAPDAAFRAKAYDALVRYEEFWRTKRRFTNGLFHYDGNAADPALRRKYCGWESGWDDSPRWDGNPSAIAPIDLNCWMILYYRSLRDLALKLGKADEAGRWQSCAQKLQELVESRLWDAREGCYFDYDTVKSEFSRVLTPASYMPLFLGFAPTDRAAAMAQHARRLAPGWPTVSYDHPNYMPTAYWRGRTWLNVAYFALKGLKNYGFDSIADEGRRTLLEWVEKGDSIYENYNSRTGSPLGSPKFGWSSVFAIKFIEDWQMPLPREVPMANADGWSLATDGGIVRLSPRRIADHFEMSSRGVDAIVEWAVSDEGVWCRKGHIRFPTLRDGKDNTYGSWCVPFKADNPDDVRVNGRAFSPGRVSSVAVRETLAVHIDHPDEGLREMRELYPSLTARAFLECIVLSNRSDRILSVEIQPRDRQEEISGVLGRVLYRAFVVGSGLYRLAPGGTISFARCASGRGEGDPCYYPDVGVERMARRVLWDESARTLELETPNPEIDALFRFAKFRTLESLYFTRGGLIHSPGGYNRYLAAIWANDQAEYACPFLACLGHPVATEAMKTCYRWFAARMNPEYSPIPSSIIAEGRGFWNGAGDRGDQAMLAHGASRAALFCGDSDFAREMAPFVAWCLEFGRRKLTSDGVIASDSDELEGRLPAGKANLCTSALHYDALLRFADLEETIGENAEEARALRGRASRLELAIERHFGGQVEGFDAYRYYLGNDRLRSWIAIPLCFGIDRRAKAVEEAIFSDKLWDGVGLRSVSGERGYWDRSTLYAFRGLSFSGRSDAVLPRLEAYTRERLLGKHVPYPVEAYPEGRGSHLAAESALYARIFTEGVFGIVPRGLRKFTVRPNLPTSWPRAALRRVRAFGAEVDLEFERTDKGVRMTISEGQPRRTVQSANVSDGQLCEISLSL